MSSDNERTLAILTSRDDRLKSYLCDAPSPAARALIAGASAALFLRIGLCHALIGGRHHSYHDIAAFDTQPGVGAQKARDLREGLRRLTATALDKIVG